MEILFNQVREAIHECFVVLPQKYLYIMAYIYLYVMNKLVSYVVAAIFYGLRGEVRVAVPASVGGVCVACGRRSMLHSGCCDDSH